MWRGKKNLNLELRWSPPYMTIKGEHVDVIFDDSVDLQNGRDGFIRNGNCPPTWLSPYSHEKLLSWYRWSPKDLGVYWAFKKAYSVPKKEAKKLFW